MPRYAEVVFNHPLRDRFSYRIPEDWESPPSVGSRVLATFSRRSKQLGFVVGLTEECDFDEKRILSLDACLDEEPIFPPLILKLLEWVADYYYCSLGRACLPPSHSVPGPAFD